MMAASILLLGIVGGHADNADRLATFRSETELPADGASLEVLPGQRCIDNRYVRSVLTIGGLEVPAQQIAHREWPSACLAAGGIDR